MNYPNECCERAESCLCRDEHAAFKQTLRMMPGYPWLPCPICVREGFKGMGGCDHIVAERARASGISFGTNTTQ